MSVEKNYKKFLERCAIFLSKFLSVRKPIRIIAIWSVFWVLAIELFLVDIPAHNKSFYQIGQIHLRLCYSFISAFVFFISSALAERNTKSKGIQTYKQ